MEEKMMSEEITEQKEQILQEDPAQTETTQVKEDDPEGIPAVSEPVSTAETDAGMNDAAAGAESTSKKKMSKKKLAIIGGAAVVAIIVLAILLIPSKFKRVKKECLNIAGQMKSGKNYFSLDTDPYEDANSTVRALLLPSTQTKTLEAIRYANEQLGFPGVYSDMMKTSALMGRQSEENSKYKVSWTYHPDHGLEVTYTKK